MTGTIGSTLELWIDKTVTMNGRTVYLRATTYGGAVTADKTLVVTVCPATGGVSVSPPATHYVGAVDVGAAGPTANLATYSAWTIADVYVGCGVSTGYDIVASASAISYI
jgi:hypothetical protein